MSVILLVVSLSRKLIRHASSSSCLEQTEANTDVKDALKFGNSKSFVFVC